MLLRSKRTRTAAEMTIALDQLAPYAIPEKALRRWADERVRRETRPDGGVVYRFHLSGSTCGNAPLEVVMTVTLDADGRITSATAEPAPTDAGCNLMCAARSPCRDGDGHRFLIDLARCDGA